MASIFKREKRMTLQEWVNALDAMGSVDSAAGEPVGEDTAMTSASVIACIRVLSTTLAMLPLPLYKRTDGGKQPAYDHPLYGILHDSPNNYQTAYEWRQQVVTHVLLHGNHYSAIERDKASGRITALLPFAYPANMEVKLVGVDPLYIYTFQDGTKQPFTQSEVLHIRGMSSNGLVGMGALDKARDPIGLALALQKFASRFFKNGANVGGVLEHPSSLSQPAMDKLRSSWDKAYSGNANAFKVAILEEGMKYAKIGATPEEAQALESRKFQTIEVCRIFGVPPHMIGDLERATFSNIEHQGIEFVTFCIAPWAKNIEQRISKQLIDEFERKEYFAEFTLAALMRGDYKSRQEGLAIMRQNGIVNADEWRSLENFNPIGGPAGTKYYMNGNMIEAGKEPKEPPKDEEPPKDDGKDDRAFVVLMADARERIGKRTDADRNPAKHAEFVRTVLEPVYRAFGKDGLDAAVAELMEGSGKGGA